MAVGSFFLDFEPIRTRFGVSRGVRSRRRRTAVLRRLHAIDATRFRQTRSRVVSLSISSAFGRDSKDAGHAHPVRLVKNEVATRIQIDHARLEEVVQAPRRRDAHVRSLS